jgi:hypothetical protein
MLESSLRRLSLPKVQNAQWPHGLLYAVILSSSAREFSPECSCFSRQLHFNSVQSVTSWVQSVCHCNMKERIAVKCKMCVKFITSQKWRQALLMIFFSYHLHVTRLKCVTKLQLPFKISMWFVLTQSKVVREPSGQGDTGYLYTDFPSSSAYQLSGQANKSRYRRDAMRSCPLHFRWADERYMSPYQARTHITSPVVYFSVILADKGSTCCG